MNDIDLTWHSTPQLWIAMRKGYCGCTACMNTQPFGMGKTQEAATKALLEYEADCSTGDDDEA
jgi:hypothetical protein